MESGHATQEDHARFQPRTIAPRSSVTARGDIRTRDGRLPQSRSGAHDTVVRSDRSLSRPTRAEPERTGARPLVVSQVGTFSDAHHPSIAAREFVLAGYPLVSGRSDWLHGQEEALIRRRSRSQGPSRSLDSGRLTQPIAVDVPSTARLAAAEACLGGRV